MVSPSTNPGPAENDPPAGTAALPPAEGAAPADAVDLQWLDGAPPAPSLSLPVDPSGPAAAPTGDGRTQRELGPFAPAPPPGRPPRPRRHCARRPARPGVTSFAKVKPPKRPVDWALMRSLAGFELALCLRSRDWSRLLAWTSAAAFALCAAPLVYVRHYETPHEPVGPQWYFTIGALLQFFYFAVVLGLVRRRLRHELQPGRVEEVVITGAGIRELFLGKALALTIAGTLVTLSSLPGLLLLAACGARPPEAGLALLLTLLPAALLGAAVGLEGVLPRPGMGHLQFLALLAAALFGFFIVSAIPAPAGLFHLKPVPMMLLTFLQAFLTTIARAVLTVFGTLDPLLAIFNAWDPDARHWLLRCGTLWAVVVAAWVRNSRRFDPQEVPILAPAAKLLAFRLVEFDPRPFRRWRLGALGLRYVQDLAFGMPPDQIPLSVTLNRPVPDFSRGNPVAVFDSVFGSRAFIRADYMALALYAEMVAGWLMTVVGRHWSVGGATGFAVAIGIYQSAFLSGRAAYGLAASIAADREKHRWPFLCLTPLTDRELLLGKATAVLQADAKVIAVAAAVPLFLGTVTVIPLRVGLLLAAMSALLPAASAFIGGLLALTSLSLNEAIVRCTLALFGPMLLVALLGVVGLLEWWGNVICPFTAAMAVGIHPHAYQAAAAAWGAIALYCALGGLGGMATARLLRARLGAGWGGQ